MKGKWDKNDLAAMSRMPFSCSVEEAKVIRATLDLPPQ